MTRFAPVSLTYNVFNDGSIWKFHLEIMKSICLIKISV